MRHIRHSPLSARKLDHRYEASHPAILADRCVALGTGMVLEPQAGTKSTALAAVRAGRDWLACGTAPANMETFELRLATMT